MFYLLPTINFLALYQREPLFFLNPTMLHSPKAENLSSQKDYLTYKILPRKKIRPSVRNIKGLGTLFHPRDKLIKYFFHRSCLMIYHKIRIFKCEKNARKSSSKLRTVFSLHVYESQKWKLAQWFVLLTCVLACVSSCVFCMVSRKKR